MVGGGQVVTIASRATSFTAVCELCCELDAGGGWTGSTFAGRRARDRGHATSRCRRGHSARGERAAPRPGAATSAAA